jgi:hypothetical protein
MTGEHDSGNYGLAVDANSVEIRDEVVGPRFEELFRKRRTSSCPRRSRMSVKLGIGRYTTSGESMLAQESKSRRFQASKPCLRSSTR